MSTIKNTRGTAVTVLSTEMNSLANNTNAIGSTTNLGSDLGFRLCEVELVVTYGTAPTANSAVLVWFVREIDGTNFEDGDASITPLRPADAIFTLRAVTTAQRYIVVTDLPPGNFKAVTRNDATGQAMASSGNTVKVRPYTESF